MNQRFVLVYPVVLVTVIGLCAGSAAAQIERFGVDDAQGSPKAVRVRARHLAFTSQIFALDESGKIAAATDAAAQTKAALEHLQQLLRHNVRAGLGDVAKLNVYAADRAAVPKVRAALADAFPNREQPAISLVVTPLPVRGSLVALDAVAVDRRTDVPAEFRGAGRFNRTGRFGIPFDLPADMMTIPADHLIFVSGQAEPGELRESVRKTCDSLLKTVEWCGGENTAIAHVKVFLGSLDDVPGVLEELAVAFQNREPFPPISFVQWTNAGPPEIEVIATSVGDLSQGDDGAAISYLTPPWMRSSPVFSKVAVTRSDQLIFTSGLYGTPRTNGETQVKSIFLELGEAVKAAGSDFRHLAKATYYVTDTDAGSMLNTLRPSYYDSKRPPAASKAFVQGVGADGCSITLDMIAVPVSR